MAIDLTLVRSLGDFLGLLERRVNLKAVRRRADLEPLARFPSADLERLGVGTGYRPVRDFWSLGTIRGRRFRREELLNGATLTLARLARQTGEVGELAQTALFGGVVRAVVEPHAPGRDILALAQVLAIGQDKEDLGKIVRAASRLIEGGLVPDATELQESHRVLAAQALAHWGIEGVVLPRTVRWKRHPGRLGVGWAPDILYRDSGSGTVVRLGYAFPGASMGTVYHRGPVGFFMLSGRLVMDRNDSTTVVSFKKYEELARTSRNFWSVGKKPAIFAKVSWNGERRQPVG